MAEQPFVKLLIRVWADDHEFLRKMKDKESFGVNLLIRQIIHNYVVHKRDELQRKIDNDELETTIDLDDLNGLADEVTNPEPAPTKGVVVEIEL